MTTAITDLSATGLARRIRDGELNATTVTDAYLDRIDARNDRTNAYVTVAHDHAQQAAEAADHARDTGEPLGPLHGVPVAIKDLDNVAGLPTTFGSRLFADHTADESDVFVTRLQAAGAIIIGKTNTPEFGLGTATNNHVAGPTGTPFDPDRIAGGSSGGAAAALGDKLAPIAQGSDTGGSIRTPAALCGVYGLKPTYGRIPRVNRPNGFSGHTPFSHLGPMARTVEDAAIMLDVMAGPHPRDPFCLPDDHKRFAGVVDTPVSQYRIAYSTDLGIYPIDPAVRETVTDAAMTLEETGARVDQVDPTYDLDQQDVLDAYYAYVTVRWEALFDSLETQGFDPRGADKDKLWPELVEIVIDANPITTREYRQADTVRTQVLDGIEDVLTDHDILLTPTTGVVPFPHDQYPTHVDGTEIEPLRGWILTQPFNFTGHPAASIPAGFVDGLPVGMQIVGRRFADDEVLAVSAALERLRPWHDAYPA